MGLKSSPRKSLRSFYEHEVVSADARLALWCFWVASDLPRLHSALAQLANMELGTPESERIVGQIYSAALEAIRKKHPISEGQRLVYSIEHLSQEVNSGASFEQYFRWAHIGEIAAIVGRLERLALNEAAAITREAISVAYPDGLPPLPENEDALADWDGSAAQHQRLKELAEQFTDHNGVIMNRLADYARSFKS